MRPSLLVPVLVPLLATLAACSPERTTSADAPPAELPAFGRADDYSAWSIPAVSSRSLHAALVHDLVHGHLRGDDLPELTKRWTFAPTQQDALGELFSRWDVRELATRSETVNVRSNMSGKPSREPSSSRNVRPPR